MPYINMAKSYRERGDYGMKRKKPIIRTAISSILIALILVVVIVANMMIRPNLVLILALLSNPTATTSRWISSIARPISPRKKWLKRNGSLMSRLPGKGSSC